MIALPDPPAPAASPGAAALIDADDWAGAPFGPRDGWPATLRIAVELMLRSRFPMFLLWGPERLCIYNDAYVPMLGGRHPALGRPFFEIWPEVRDELAPLIERTFAGEACYFEDLPLTLHRRGYAEAAWFTFSYSPLRDEGGAVVGMFCACTETTPRVQAEVALRDAEASQRRLLESITDSFFVLDEAWRFTYLNPQADALLGQQGGALLGCVLWEAYPGVVGSVFEPIYRGAMEGRRAGSITSFYPDHDRWYQVRTFPAERGISVFFQDVTEHEKIELERRRIEGRYRSLVEASAQVVWRLNAAGQADEPLPGWEAFTGQGFAEAAGQGWRDAIHPAHRARLDAAWAAGAASGTLELEYALRRRDGAWRDVVSRGVALRDAAGGILEWIGTLADVTEARRTERRLALALEGTTDGPWDWDILTNEVFHSPRFAEMLGYAPEEWHGHYDSWLAHLHPEDLHGATQVLRRYLDGALPEYANVFRMRHRDGHWVWVLSRAKALRDAEGRPVRMVGAHTDITAQKQAEAALRESEARFRTMADTVPTIMFTAAADGRLEWQNRRWYEVTGAAPGLSGDASWSAQIDPGELERVTRDWYAAIRDGTGYEAELRLRDAQGGYRWHLCRARPVRDALGAVSGWVGTGTDIDDQRRAAEVLARSRAELEQLVEARTEEVRRAAEERHRAEEALRHSEKLQALGQLTGGIAHDFGNVMQVVEGGLHLLRKPALDEARRAKVLDGVAQAAGNARALIAQLMAFARQQPLEPAAFDLNARLAGMTELLRHSLGGRLRLETALAEGLPMVTLDASQLETALLNLVVNARAAMPEGGTLTLATERAGGRVALTVRDTGQGMPPEVRARIFEPFFTTKPPGEGTGLGLAQVHGFIAQSGGEIEVESAPGAGTAFRLLLPTSSSAR